MSTYVLQCFFQMCESSFNPNTSAPDTWYHFSLVVSSSQTLGGAVKFLEQFILLQLERNDDRHLSNEALTCLSAHLLAKSQVDAADASAAFEVAQRLISDPVTH